ncbi:MAG: NAD-dependent deacylase [Armatimonadetes bacterium]|nr:NAD-dependent deacylase [Armatimonadota bacterium]
MDLARAADFIARAVRTVALTGAGISVPSGIPDYRSANTGVWENYDPMAVANIEAFRRDPAPFYTAYAALGRALLVARPNPAHVALARLEQMGVLTAVITQNIDSLHQAAGSRTVYELHGNLRGGACLACRKRVAFRPLLERLVADEELPVCADCGAVIKPDVVLFGENLPRQTLMKAAASAQFADVCLCVGTSLVVYPAAAVPLETLNGGGAVIIVNREPTPLDREAAAVLRGDVAEVLPALADAVAERWDGSLQDAGSFDTY